jgi:surface protein
MFANASKFNQDIHLWNTAKVTEMHEMFSHARAFNQDGLSSWDTRNVKSMRHMFLKATAFKQPLCWDATNDTFEIFTGTGSGDKPAAAWGKRSARGNCEYDWLFLANRQHDSGDRMQWPFSDSTAWVRYG